MNIEQTQVRNFMVAAQQEIQDKPTVPGLDVRILRAKLLLEETIETIRDGLGLELFIERNTYDLHDLTVDIAEDENWQEINSVDLIQVADGCADVKVVTDGLALACGIDLEPVMEEVDRSNMSKFIDGHRREDGKWIKGPSYSPADIRYILINQGM